MNRSFRALVDRTLDINQGPDRPKWRRMLRWRVNSGFVMARYIDKIIQPGERLLYSTNEHWMYFLPAIAAWIVVVAFLVLWRFFTSDVLASVCLAFAAVAGLAALYWTATAWFHRWTTETDVTNMRVVHKTGFIRRDTFEMSLDKVESVDVKQSILGRFMDYGDLTIQGVGEGTRTITTITAPLAFRNAITTRPVGT
jgi:membrane protein YdbS with pleckstrin-like domain